MANIITENIPDLGFNLGVSANIITALIVIVFISVLLGLGLFFFIRNKQFSSKVVIFEKVSGRFEPTKKDRARFIPIGKGGDTVFLLKKFRKVLPNPEIQTGRNTYWYAIREDGEWINIGIEDIDTKARLMGARFLDKEMRYARTSLQAGIKERYEKSNWFKEHASLIVNIAAIVIIMVFLWLIVDKLIDLSSSVSSAVDAARAVLEETKNILGSLDNLQGGSGIRQV